MEHWAQLYELWSSQIKAGADLPFQQEFFVNFYQSFLLNDRWMQYLQGLGRTLQITVMALIIGVILGVAVAVLRTAHDQQRVGQRSMVLGIINTVCKLYTTIIRGTPMMVQLLIMSLVIFSHSRDFAMVGALTLGINSGAYVAEIVRSGLMSVDAGQMEGRAEPGAELQYHNALCGGAAGD